MPMMGLHHNGDWINALEHLSNKSQFILETGESRTGFFFMYRGILPDFPDKGTDITFLLIGTAQGEGQFF